MEEPEKIVSQTELDDKAQKLVEEKDADSRLRVYVGPMEKALTAVLLIWAVFQVWANMFGTLGAVKLRTAHIMFLLPLAFTLYPTFKKERRRRFMPVWDIALIAAAILSYGYLFMRYDAIAKKGRLNSTDVWVGVVCLVVAFEAARRASGNLAIIALIFLSYFAVWGRYIPGTFGTSAFTLKRVIKALVWDTNGVLGTGAGVSATYIFVFVLFGAFLKYSGFSQFINDIALTLVGQTPGGPAKVAVIASALMGMINGSAIANVATTGTITIPLMKKTGYKKDFAAAVEAVASTGGQFTPPIMGAVGFVMAEFMCVSYTKVMLAAAIPAFLYYLSLLYSVHLEAKRLGLSGLAKENIPKAGEVLRARGHLLIPLIVLLALIGGNMIRGGGDDSEDGESCSVDPTKGRKLLILAVATSIDALAVGLSFSLLNINVWGPSTLIGVVCAVITALGLLAGKGLAHADIFGRRAELVGGCVLIGIGLKILYEHGVLS